MSELKTRFALALRAFRGVEPTYPTPWAYEKACAALWEHRDRADALEGAVLDTPWNVADGYDVDAPILISRGHWERLRRLASMGRSIG